MTPERLQQIEDLYHSALEHDSGERMAFVAESCDGDDELRQEVVSLLASHEQAQDFIEAPVHEVAARLIADKQERSMVGRIIGHYEFIELLGTGGMGEVYLARDRTLGRQVALKLLPNYFTKVADRLRRFEQEAHTASSLNHPNIVTIYEIGQADGHQFIATEFIDGLTLRERMAKSRFDLRQTLDAAIQVGGALETAHAAGIVHRDIKPENIMVRPDGYVKVLDFGLAKLTELHAPAVDSGAATRALVETGTGLVMGTASYMSPEQARGMNVDPRTDIFSLGIVLYEMVTGRVPFEGATKSDVLASILKEEPPPLSLYAPELPSELERIVTKALAKEREERYQVVKDLLIDLRTLRQELELQAKSKRSTSAGAAAAVPTMSSAEYLIGQAKRHKLRTTLMLALFITTVAVVGLGLHKLANRSGSLPAGASSPQIKSLAVLPLKSLSKDSNDEYLGLGLADTIIARVSQINDLTVRPTSAVRKYSNQQINSLEAARELQVDSVLDGSIQRAADHLRINLNLLRTQDGASLWSYIFDLNPTDTFKMQDEVSQQVATRLRLKLRPQKATHTINAEAYDDYLRAKFHSGLNNLKDNEAAIKLLERATTIDQNFAAAYATLAQEYWTRAQNLKPQEKEWEEKAYAATERALSLDPDLAEAHVARGLALWTHSNHFPHALAVQEFRRALDLNPNLDEAHHQLGNVYDHIGLLDRAEEEIQKAVAINPGNTGARFRVGVNLLYQGKDEEALAAFRDSEKFDPPLWAYQIACALFHLGRKEEAAARVAEALKNNPQYEGGTLSSIQALLAASNGETSKAEAEIQRAAATGKDFRTFHHAAYTIACAYALLNKAEPAVKWLQMAADDGFPCYPLFEGDPNLNNLRRDQRFIAFMAKLKEQWERYQATL